MLDVVEELFADSVSVELLVLEVEPESAKGDDRLDDAGLYADDRRGRGSQREGNSSPCMSNSTALVIGAQGTTVLLRNGTMVRWLLPDIPKD